MANSVVRFQHNADALVRFVDETEAGVYSVYFSLLGSENWSSFTSYDNEFVLSELLLDTFYTVYLRTGTGITEEVTSDTFSISTYPQSKPLAVSEELYFSLAAFFSGEYPDTTQFCTFLDDMDDIHLIEKLSFLQGYAYDNTRFSRASSGTDFVTNPQWYANFTGYNSESGSCLPEWAGGCRCEVVTQAAISATPGRPEEDDAIPKYNWIPHEEHRTAHANRKKDDTHVRIYLSGAAKYVSLYNHEGNGGMGYQMSNIAGANNGFSISPLSTRIFFFLGCMNSNGTITTSLPEGCDCVRPLRIDYEYTTRLWVKANAKSCPWSKGAWAHAEDMAFVTVANRKTEQVQVLAAGNALASRKFEHNWNPEFWVNIVSVVQQAAELFIGEKDSTLNSTQIDDLANSVKTLITTKFSIKEGVSGDLDENAALVQGFNNLLLRPNEPLTIGLFSAYNLNTKGYGCYESEAIIASDYYLLGVVESENRPFDHECCTDKYAAFSLASLVHKTNHHNPPIHTEQELRHDLGALLATYGSWHPKAGYTFPGSTGGTGQIGISENIDFDRLAGPSCIKDQFAPDPDSAEQRSIVNLTMGGNALSFEVFPTLVNNATANLIVKSEMMTNIELSLYDIAGRRIRTFPALTMQPGTATETLNFAHVNNGAYWLLCDSPLDRQLIKIIVQN